MRRRPPARRASGFTLLEVLVVVVIIGIIAGMAMISVKVLGGDHEMDQEAARLQAILTQTRDDAMLLGTDVGLRLDERGYGFLRYDTRHERWLAVDDDPMLRGRSLPEGLTLALRLEDHEFSLKPREGDAGQLPLLPQVVVQASGELVPFDVVLRRDGTQEVRRVSGTLDGRIEVHDDTPRQR